MSVWHDVLDSDQFRTFTRRGPGRAIVKSRAYAELGLACNYARTARAARQAPGCFDDVETFCCFVGHNKSGNSLLGALLDAQRDIVLSDEVDLLRYVGRGFRRDQLFALAVRGARNEARKGRMTARRLSPYSYAVPGHWQGRTDRPRVVGDSTTGTATRRLAADPGLLDQIVRTMRGVEVKFVQTIRNPFDPISVMMVRGERSFPNAIEHYFTACDALVGIRGRVGPALLPVRYEHLVAEPHAGVARVCNFLGVALEPSTLDACASIVKASPDRSRDLVEWTSPWIELVESRMTAYDFLDGYSYER
jgi:hypothetical protein